MWAAAEAPVTDEGLGWCLGTKVCSRRDRPPPIPERLLALGDLWWQVSGGFPIVCPSYSPPIVPSCSQVYSKPPPHPHFSIQLPMSCCAGCLPGGSMRAWPPSLHPWPSFVPASSVPCHSIWYPLHQLPSLSRSPGPGGTGADKSHSTEGPCGLHLDM